MYNCTDDSATTTPTPPTNLSKYSKTNPSRETNARREQQHASAPTQTHPTSGNLATRRNDSDDAATAYLGSAAAAAKRTHDEAVTDAGGPALLHRFLSSGGLPPWRR